MNPPLPARFTRCHATFVPSIASKEVECLVPGFLGCSRPKGPSNVVLKGVWNARMDVIRERFACSGHCLDVDGHRVGDSGVLAFTKTPYCSIDVPHVIQRRGSEKRLPATVAN